MRRTFALVATVAFLLALTVPAAAQNQQPQQVAMPDAEKIVLLVRNSLITLNDALQTGNFTVLRDQGAPGFRAANTAAERSRIFSGLTAKQIDLSAVSVITPKLAQKPSLDREKGMLHLKGYFPGEPVQINSELLYQAVNGRWRLVGISVQPGSSTGPPLSAEGSHSTSAETE